MSLRLSLIALRGLLPVALSLPSLAQCPNDDWREDNDTCATPAACVPGNQFGLIVTATDEDYFGFVVPAGRTMTVRVRFQHAAGDIDAFLYDVAAGCMGTPLAEGTSQSNEELLVFQNTGATDLDCVLRLTLVNGVCNSYDLGLSLTGSPISCPSADRFEPNDTVATAARIVPGAYLWLNAPLMGDRDIYSIEVPSGSSVIVRTLEYVSQPTDAAGLVLYDASGTQTLDFDFAVGSTLQEVRWDNITGAPAVVNALFTFQVGASSCLDYVLGVVVNTCGLTSDDPLEDNDTCGAAVALPLGATVGLQVFTGDADFYATTVPNRTTLDFAVDYDRARGELLVELYRGSACNTLDRVGVGVAMPTGQALLYTNAVGGAETFTLRVAYAGVQEGCNEYALTAAAVPGMLGSYICAGVANSTGSGAHLVALGSDAAADNVLTLEVDGLPNFSAGFFLNSFDNGFIANPGGSSGNICISGPRVGRHDDDIVFSGTTGRVALTLDLTQIPQPTGPYAVLAGDLVYWQYWYRDVLPQGGTTSNLSDALGILFL